MECWLFGPEMDIFAYLHSPSSGEEAPQFRLHSLVCPKKRTLLNLGEKWAGKEGGRKMEGTAHELSLSK